MSVPPATAGTAGRRGTAFLAGSWAIARRELSSYFHQPAGWIVIALMMFLMGVVFALVVLVPGRPASMRAFFEASGWLLLPVAPAISMRLFAEELRSGTFEPLCTSPLSTAALVVGKYAGAVLFLVAMLTPTVLLPIVLRLLSDPRPDAGPVLAGYLCLLLLGMLYIALGMLASACTTNATLAFLITLFGILGLLLVGGASQVGWLPGWARDACEGLSTRWRVADFAKGVVDSAHAVYFLTLSGFLLLLSGGVLHLRRSL
ncbi:MAG: ABC transporter permease [Phycisphaerales bacterium]